VQDKDQKIENPKGEIIAKEVKKPVSAGFSLPFGKVAVKEVPPVKTSVAAVAEKEIKPTTKLVEKIVASKVATQDKISDVKITTPTKLSTSVNKNPFSFSYSKGNTGKLSTFNDKSKDQTPGK
jgi:hypothetical protein